MMSMMNQMMMQIMGQQLLAQQAAAAGGVTAPAPAAGMDANAAMAALAAAAGAGAAAPAAWQTAAGAGASTAQQQSSGYDPTRQKKTKLCTYHLQGGCRTGSACCFAHGEHELGTFADPSATPDGPKGVGKGPAGPPVPCSIHGKKRSSRNMIDDMAGGLRCAPGFECQTGGDEVACSIHGKKRGMNNLMEDGSGGWVCQPGFECVMGAGSQEGPRKKYKLCTFWEQGGCSRGRACTFAHGQEEIGLLSDPTAEPDGGTMTLPGDWTCPGCGDHQFARNTQCRKCSTLKPGDGETLPPEPTMTCTVHGVERGVMQLTNDGAGGICCKPGLECNRGKGKGKGKDDDGVQKKWRMCTFHVMGGCKFGSTCGFAHDESEIGEPAIAGPQYGGGGKGKDGKGKGPLPGDWYCPGCGDHQFARNMECRKCGEANPNPVYMVNPNVVKPPEKVLAPGEISTGMAAIYAAMPGGAPPERAAPY